MGANYRLKNAQLVQSESNFKGLDHFKFLCNTVKEASLLWQALEKVSNSQKVSMSCSPFANLKGSVCTFFTKPKWKGVTTFIADKRQKQIEMIHSETLLSEDFLP